MESHEPQALPIDAKATTLGGAPNSQTLHQNISGDNSLIAHLTGNPFFTAVRLLHKLIKKQPDNTSRALD